MLGGTQTVRQCNKKAPKGAFIFIRMECHRRTALTDLVAAGVVDAVAGADVAAAVVDLDSAAALVLAG